MILRSGRFTVFCFLSFFLSSVSYSQDCNSTIAGFIKDESSGESIPYANVFLKELQKGAISDSLGFFRLESVCPGKYHISISHVGCETKELFLGFTKDTTIEVWLDHNSQLLNDVSIIGQRKKSTTQDRQSLNSDLITQNSNRNLATMLENMTGVSTINNGSGISKPVVHGLYGNRLTILNNGVAQSGQQWGVDHSPEIDPLVANRITVVKGVGALEYQGNSLGSVILVEPKKIRSEPHLHGGTRYFFESNGLGNGINLELQQHHKIIAWRVVGTLKKSGDNNTPDYYLRNTGNEEANVALQLEKLWNKKWFSDLYLSSFNAELGVLRGSHIGNLTDLEEAFTRDVPFYTEDEFSYSIDAPYQKVNHHLLKFHTRYNLSKSHWIDFTYSGQYNLRKEFDVRRSGRSDAPALSLEQFTNFLEGKYTNHLANDLELKTGIQYNRVDNANLPETGVIPLIPDYISNEYGVFGLVTKRIKKVSIEFGGRYDYEQRNVATISNRVPRTIVRHQNDYHNISGVLGFSYDFLKSWNLSYNIGYAARNPEVNELYSKGLHQGVSGIEEGDPNLAQENSLKNTLSLKGKVKGRLFFESLVYYQEINNYIFLNPQDEFRLTIRGAFPVFKYEQTDARLVGFDMAATYKVTEAIEVIGKYSYLHGYDKGNMIPLVYMPANNLYGELNYRLPKWGKFRNVEFQLNYKYVFEQKNLLPSQDFVPAPKAYDLVGAKISIERQWSKLGLKLFIRGENLLNNRYRDYLNRQRYFADDLGFNVIVGINMSF